jgi:hypothetical protein
MHILKVHVCLSNINKICKYLVTFIFLQICAERCAKKTIEIVFNWQSEEYPTKPTTFSNPTAATITPIKRATTNLRT